MGSFEPTPGSGGPWRIGAAACWVSAAAGSAKTKVLVERLFGYMGRALPHRRLPHHHLYQGGSSELRAGSPQS